MNVPSVTLAGSTSKAIYRKEHNGRTQYFFC